MSNSGKNMRKLEQKFNTLRQKGNKEVSLQLSEAQATFVREELKLPIYAILYEIQTMPIESVTSAAGILQELHRSYKRGEKTIRKPIHGKDFNALESAGAEFRAVRYRVVLARG
jgi:hypothetical protein